MTTRTSLKTRLGFGAGEFSSSIFFTVTSFWLLNFLTDEVRLSAGLAGLALLVGKIWDAVIDPLIGYVSDRTRSRWGRRRPYFLFFGIPFGIAFYLMFRNPGLEDSTAKFIWTMLTYTFFCTVYSLTNIPYNALLPELSKDYDERTHISGYKQAFAVIGTLIGAGVAMPIIAAFPSRTTGFAVMGAFYGLLATISILSPFFTIREGPPPRQPESATLLDSLKGITANKPYLLILGAWLANTTGVAVIMAMMIYYYKYIFQSEDSVTLALVSLLIAAIACIPLWVKLSARIGKKSAYIAGMTITAISVILFAFLGEILGVNGSLAIVILAGIGFSSHYVLPWSMVPDTLEYDFAHTGMRREGIFYSVWTFSVSVGGAVAAFIVGTGLDLIGYFPDTSQTPTAIAGIRFLMGPVPGTLFLLGNLFLVFYPLTRQKYDELMQTIQEQKQRPGVFEDIS